MLIAFENFDRPSPGEKKVMETGNEKNAARFGVLCRRVAESRRMLCSSLALGFYMARSDMKPIGWSDDSGYKERLMLSPEPPFRRAEAGHLSGPVSLR